MAEPKATWGGYFASYVRKKPPAEAPVATAVPKDDDKPPPPNVLKPVDVSAGQETKPKTTPVKKPSEGFQRSTSGTKKLYAIPKEPVVSEALAVQRSASNASRMAKMFGYSGNSSTPPEPEKIVELPVAPLIAMVETPSTFPAQEITEKLSAASIINVPKSETMPAVEAALQYTKEDTVVPIIQKTKKDDTQDMLDYFARQLETPVDEHSTLAGKKRFDTPYSKAIDTIVVEKPAQTPVRSKPKAVDMLDLLANQLDSSNDNLASASGKINEDSKVNSTERVVNKTKPTQSKANALDMLNFFSSQLDSTDPKPAPRATKKTDVPGPLPAQTEMPPMTRKDSMWSRQGSATSSELNMVMKGRNSSAPRPQSSSKPVEVSMETSRTASRYGDGDEQLRREREFMEAERERMLQLEKQAEIIISEREQMDIERQKMLEEQLRFDEEARRIADEEESMRKFIENVERERQLDFENEEKKRIRREAEEAELKRIAAEQEAERLRIQMEEEAEQRRIAAEQEAERLRIQMEEDARRAAENERAEREVELERRRVEKANREEADRLAAETRRSEEEAERLYYEEQERTEEAAGQQSRADKEREEEERYEIALADEEARLREVDRQKRRAAQLANSEVQAREDERIERETRRAMTERADRAYEEEEAERARAVGADRLADAYKFDMDVTGQAMISPSVYEDELYEDESDEDENDEDEKDEDENDKDENDEDEKAEDDMDEEEMAEDDMDEDEMDEDEMDEDEMDEDEMEDDEEEEREETKEEKLQKAEEKIRMAFAGMAEERARKPSAAIPSPNPIREDTRMMRNDRMPMPMPSARRDLNVGNQNARPRPDVGGSRFNTAGGAGAAGPRPLIRGGLPSGPRGGGGLPGGPRPRR